MVRRALLAFLFLIFSAHLHAAEPENLHAFAGVGNNFAFPGTVRIGWKAWEFGMINQSFYGGTKNFYFHRHYYTAFGLGFVSGQTGASPALTAAAGANWLINWGFGIRVELSANASSNGNVFEHGVAGVHYDF